MAMPHRPIFQRSNEDIANAIRNQATPYYQKRVPIATQANLRETFQAINQSKAIRNEFESALVEKIAMQIVRDTKWDNPLSKFKRPQLTYGSTIEEIQVGLLNAYSLDNSADYGDEAIWSRETPRVDVSYHTVNRKDVYKVTIPQEALRSAFINEGGLASFASALLDAPVTSDNWDEFLLMSSLLSQYEEADGFYKVQVPDLASGSQDNARAALRKLRESAGNLGFISERYNAAHMPSHAKPDDLELLITPEANAALDVDALSAAFNIDRAEIGYRTTLVGSEYFGIDGAQAVLTSRDFFVVADQVYETASIQNPANLTQQHFLHHWQVISASRFVPAILFTTNAGDSITLTPRVTDTVEGVAVVNAKNETTWFVERGSTYRVVGEGVTADGDQTATVITLTNAKSPRTYVTQNGSLHIGPDETADVITVTLTATDSEKSAFVNVNVFGDTVHMWPNPEVMVDEDRDGLDEVTPAVPEVDVKSATVRVPKVRGVQYRTGAAGAEENVSAGSVVDVPVTLSAVARSGFELADGADAGPWDLDLPQT